MFTLNITFLCSISLFFSAAFVLPSRDSLSLGERVIAYLPRCADTSSEVRKLAAQVILLLQIDAL